MQTTPIVAQSVIEPGQMPLILAEVAAIALAVAVIVVFLTVYAPPLVRDVRDWYRERRDDFDRADRARMNTVVRISDRKVH
jgi:hypothetical protein